MLNTSRQQQNDLKLFLQKKIHSKHFINERKRKRGAIQNVRTVRLARNAYKFPLRCEYRTKRAFGIHSKYVCTFGLVRVLGVRVAFVKV